MFFIWEQHMTSDDPVLTSLEYMAEQQDDITRPIYERFARRCPEWAALMDHMDNYMLGRMMSDVLTLLMTPPAEIDRHYLSFEVDSHRAYGVTPNMFPPLLEAVRDTLKDSLKGQWQPAMEEAWHRRIEALAEEIDRLAAEPVRA
jgi:hemoglobin-like flavoprotein